MSASGTKPLGGGLFGKESALTMEVYLNLTPLMDVMSNILFFLLASFGASALAVLSTTVPVQSTEDSSIASEEDKVTVTVVASVKSLSCNHKGVNPKAQLTPPPLVITW